MSIRSMYSNRNLVNFPRDTKRRIHGIPDCGNGMIKDPLPKKMEREKNGGGTVKFILRKKRLKGLTL